MLLGPGCPDPIHYWKPGPAEGTREVGEKLSMHFEELQYSAEHPCPYKIAGELSEEQLVVHKGEFHDRR